MRINELLAIADNDHATASYQYNHALQGVSKTVKTDKDSQTTNYLWHGGMIDAEIQNGQVTKRYIFINLRPVAVIEYENDTKGDVFHLLCNRLCAAWRVDSTHCA